MPGHSTRLSEDRIVFNKPEKPILRKGKRTLIEKATAALHSIEIKELYSGTTSSELSLPLLEADKDQSAMEKSIKDPVEELADLPNLSNQQDPFRVHVGMNPDLITRDAFCAAVELSNSGTTASDIKRRYKTWFHLCETICSSACFCSTKSNN